MPKPVIDAIAPAIVAAKGSQIVESTLYYSGEHLVSAIELESKSTRRARIICVQNVAHLLSPSHSVASVNRLLARLEKDYAPVSFSRESKAM